MSRNRCRYVFCLDALRIEYFADGVRHLRRVHDRSVHHRVRRQHFHAEAHQLISRLRRFQFHGLDRTGSDIQSHELPALFSHSKHFAAPFLANVPISRDSLPPPRGRLTHLPFHPAVQDRFTQFPTVAEFKRGNFAFRDVTVQGIRGDAQILGRLPHIHHFARFAHEERHPGIRTHSKSRPFCSSPTALRTPGEAARGSFMTFYHSERQGNL